MWHDIRVAIRGFRQSPGFTFTALLTLTLAIGANATVFSLLNALVLRDANVRDPRSLVQVSSVTQPHHVESGVTYAMYGDFKRRQQVFSSVIGWRSNGVYNIDVDAQHSRGLVAAVSGNFFDELGARAAAGRLLTASDINETSADPSMVAVLGHAFWQRAFASDPAAIGRRVAVEGTAFTVDRRRAAGFRRAGVVRRAGHHGAADGVSENRGARAGVVADAPVHVGSHDGTPQAGRLDRPGARRPRVALARPQGGERAAVAARRAARGVPRGRRVRQIGRERQRGRPRHARTVHAAAPGAARDRAARARDRLSQPREPDGRSRRGRRPWHRRADGTRRRAPARHAGDRRGRRAAGHRRRTRGHALRDVDQRRTREADSSGLHRSRHARCDDRTRASWRSRSP